MHAGRVKTLGTMEECHVPVEGQSWHPGWVGKRFPTAHCTSPGIQPPCRGSQALALSPCRLFLSHHVPQYCDSRPWPFAIFLSNLLHQGCSSADSVSPGWGRLPVPCRPQPPCQSLLQGFEATCLSSFSQSPSQRCHFHLWQGDVTETGVSSHLNHKKSELECRETSSKWLQIK